MHIPTIQIHTKSHLHTIMIIAHQLMCQKWMRMLFREYPQPPVLYWTHKSQCWNLPHTIKIPSLVDDVEYLFYAYYNVVQYAHSISTLELLHLYGIIRKHGEINPALLFFMDSTLDGLLPHSLSNELWRTILDTSILRSHILVPFKSLCDRKIFTSQYFHIE